MAGGDGREVLDRTACLVERVGGGAGLVDGAAVAERGVGVEQLQGRHDGPALAERHLHVVSHVPTAVRKGLRVGRVQPLSDLWAVDPRDRLAGQVDPGGHPNSIAVGHVLNGAETVLGPLVPEQESEVVEVGVVGAGEGSGHVHRPQTFRPERAGPARAARDREASAVVVDGVGRDDPTVECSGRGEHLERGAWRVETSDRPVDEREVASRVLQVGVGGRRDPADPDRGVVTRERGHGQHRPVAGVEHDGGGGVDPAQGADLLR